MAFSLAVTPEPGHVPPRCVLTATESDASKPLQSCQFFRNGAALRFAAIVAGSTAFVYDYDAPFDQALDYRADAVELTSLVLAWTDTFSNLSAWSGPAGSVYNWTATGGKAQATTSNAVMTRGTGSDNIGKVSGTNPAFAGTATTGQFVISITNAADQVVASLKFGIQNQTITLGSFDGVQSVSGKAPTSFDIVFSDTSVTASGTGWTLTVPYHSDYDLNGITLEVLGAFTGTRTVTLDDLTVYASVVPATTTNVTASDTEALTGITGVWMTNAVQPELALAIDDCSVADPDYSMGEETRRQTTSKSTSAQLDIEGSSRYLTVVNGPRKDETFPLEVTCRTEEARKNFKALVANSSPVSLRFPASMSDLGVDDGFYDLGDITGERLTLPRISQESTYSMTLTPAYAPEFDVVGQWTWGTVAQSVPTWGDLLALYPTWMDLLVGPDH